MNKQSPRSKLLPCPINNPSNRELPRRISPFLHAGLALLLGLLAPSARAATAVWTPGGTDTNWSTGGNWVGGTGTAGVPASTDDVLFNNGGSSSGITIISNVVDSTSGNFGGTISSLSYTNNANNSYQNTLILPGLTLTITNNTGPFASALFAGTPTAAAATAAVFDSIQGPGATLFINNTNANISVSQSGASTALATLILTNLDTLIANVNVIAIGDMLFGVASVASQGSLILAKTNTITTAWVGNHSNPYGSSAQPTNSIAIGVGGSGTLGGINALFLGLTNGIFTDSIAVGGVKSGGSAASPARMAFSPVFTNSSPTAYFRGINGNNSRIAFWGVGDTAIGSSSSAQCFGNADFSNGSIDALVDTMVIGRERNSTAALDAGVFTFTAGNLNVNTLDLGFQGAASTSAASSGAMNVSGPNATLRVNSTLELGHTTQTGVASALNTRGVLTIFNGATVNANNIIVGVSSITNIIAMTNGTLIVTNTLATNAAGLLTLAMTNSTVGFNIADGSLKCLTGTLTTGGATNVIRLGSVAVLGNYPAQIPLIKYTNAAIGGVGFNFGLANVPISAPGAYLSNNVANHSVDLALPYNPAPVITVQPTSYSGSPGDNVTTNYVVVVAPNSVPPLSYQWYYTNGLGTNALADGTNPSGSTNFGTATASYFLTNAQSADNGGYFVVVTNNFGAATSVMAQLTISSGCTPPMITGPNNQTVIQFNNATFSASVSANPAAALQWQTNGTDVPGANSLSVTFNNVQYPADDQKDVSLIASNGCGLFTNHATLTVIVPPFITLQPTNVVVTNTQPASFTVAATGVPAVWYQWNKNGSPISSAVNNSATNATLSIASASASDIANYSCTITNLAGLTNSASVSLTVNSLMSAVALSPANGASGICYDTPLYITFSQSPLSRAAGKIRIYNATNSATPVDTLDLGQGNPQQRSNFPGDSQAFNYYPIIITGSTAAVYPHSGVMTSNQTYYVTVDSGVFTDSTGAYFVGISDTNAWRFATKPGGPANPLSLVVAADGSGDFVTVQGGVDSVPSGNTTPRLISIRDGLYTEIVNISGKNNLTLRGQTRQGTIIGYANNSLLAPGGSTHARMAFKVNANDISLDNLTITNSTPQDLTQAEALMIETSAARIIVNNATLDSYQDTVLANTATSKAYFNNSLIQGDIDFIWGGGNLFFTNCEVRWTLRPSNQQGLGPNPSPSGSEVFSNGFSFINCRLTTAAPVSNDAIGRTRGIAGGETVLITSLISSNLGGWASDAAATNSFRNYYYSCSNLSATATVTLSNGIPLSANDPIVANASSATIWLYGWQPQLSVNILTNPVSLSVAGGASASFNVVATGVPDPSYQWLQNGSVIPGQTSTNLSIPNAYASNAATYSVIVSNSSGSVTSSPATLTVGNTAPTLASIPDTNINVGVSLSIASQASDPDVPPQTLTFSLLSGPTNATVDANSGVFAFRPVVAQANSSTNVTIKVTDNGSPNLSATQTFNVTVNPLTQPGIGSLSATGGVFSITVSGETGPDYAVQAATNLTDWGDVFTTNSPAMPFNWTDPNPATLPQRFYRIIVGPPLP